MFYKIEESVGRYYITLPDSYKTREAAEQAMAREPSNQCMRVMAYEAGSYGPRRVVDGQE